MNIHLLDCTLRDGGYHNSWDFSSELIENYLNAMEAISVDFIEIGFRTLDTGGYRGGCAYSTDSYIHSLRVPPSLKLAVMVNAGELVRHPDGVASALAKLFAPAVDSPVSLVRLACHLAEIEPVMPGISWLKDAGYMPAINLMQIADRTDDELNCIAKLASNYPVEVLYFADSMGSLTPEKTAAIIRTLRTHWRGELGIHTHDNTCQGLANSMRAVREGVTWVDGTVTGMGRGPGNTKTEYLAIELEQHRHVPCNPTKLFTVINEYFRPLQSQYGWGTNPFYYLAGRYGIHPTYIQEMLADVRYVAEDILAVIEYLRHAGGKKFSPTTLEEARYFYDRGPKGTWVPADIIAGKEVVILGAGPGVNAHQWAVEQFIRTRRPFVIALNTQARVAPDLIDVRAACHPLRLLADCDAYACLPQPLVAPVSQLPEAILGSLEKTQLLDFGLQVRADTFLFHDSYCVLPNALVVAYALSIATSGRAKCIFCAGFDGYGSDDPRTIEMNHLLAGYKEAEGALKVMAITPTKYEMPTTSVYAM